MRTSRYEFTNEDGQTLSGRLEEPASTPRAYAIFAHCFTCSSNVKAATYISRALRDRGFAVLRFDFTGLGNSEGDFSNTNFSSNVADLQAAAASLRETHEAPRLLIGHSLGGAAAMAAAGDLAEVNAVATIGAPSEPTYIMKLLTGQLERIEKHGEAEISLAGRTFTIKRQFIDDMQRRGVRERLRDLNAALLIYHSPVDSIVAIDNAREIYEAANHPKSFISLDEADHLVTDANDARFIADTLCAWAERYMPSEGPRDEDDGSEDEGLPEGVVEVREAGPLYAQQVRSGAHRLTADEPKKVGGRDAGPSPYEFLLAALGSCTSMTLRMYADRKGWPLERATVQLRHENVHADDSHACVEEGSKISRITREIALEGSLDESQREKLLEIADKCPVHRSLSNPAEIVTSSAEADEDAQSKHD